MSIQHEIDQRRAFLQRQQALLEERTHQEVVKQEISAAMDVVESLAAPSPTSIAAGTTEKPLVTPVSLATEDPVNAYKYVPFCLLCVDTYCFIFSGFSCIEVRLITAQSSTTSTSNCSPPLLQRVQRLLPLRMTRVLTVRRMVSLGQK